MIRLFAALPVPYEIAEGLSRRQQGVPRARWRPLDSLHITLRFFGELSEPTAADLDAALAGVASPPFELQLEGVGMFGDDERGRALFASVSDSDPLKRLALKCENAARRVGLKSDARAYRPHVTLAYLRGSPPDRIAAWMQGHNLLRSPSWRATTFYLYSSWSGPDGARYDVERAYALR